MKSHQESRGVNGLLREAQILTQTCHVDISTSTVEAIATSLIINRTPTCLRCVMGHQLSLVLNSAAISTLSQVWAHGSR